MIGHDETVVCVGTSEDGKQVVSWSRDKKVRIWDVENGEQVRNAKVGHERAVVCVELSPDGLRVVSGSHDNTVRVWDVDNGAQVGRSMTGHEDSVLCVGVSEDGLRVVSGSHDKTVRVWDVEGSELVGNAMVGHELAVVCVELSEDGRYVVSGSHDNTVRVWDVQSSLQIGSSFSLEISRTYYGDGLNLNQSYTEWLDALLNILLQRSSVESKHLCLSSLHFQVSKITNQLGYYFTPSLTSCFEHCESKRNTDLEISRHSLIADSKTVKVAIEHQNVEIATLPAACTYAVHGMTTVHGCIDGRVIICKLEE